MNALRQSLPEGVALIGSDYGVGSTATQLGERVQQGRAAAQRIATWLH
jgi:hypothetical protein